MQFLFVLISGLMVSAAIAEHADMPHLVTSIHRALAPSPSPSNVKPWETIVRLVVKMPNGHGHGSGTIISSDEKEIVILTADHVVADKGASVSVDFFDGKLTTNNKNESEVKNRVGSAPATIAAEDPTKDLALIRVDRSKLPKELINHVFPTSKILPSGMRIDPGEKLTTAGCSKGNIPTCWTTYCITRHEITRNDGTLEVVACTYPPKRGRSGGGVFTQGNYLAGVCAFAVGGERDPKLGKGLYCSENEVRSFLTRNGFSDLVR